MTAPTTRPANVERSTTVMRRRTRPALAALALTSALACGPDAPTPAPPTHDATAQPAPPSGVAAEMERLSRADGWVAPRREVDWSLIQGDPWVTRLGRFEQAVEVDQVCLGRTPSPRCSELRRMLDRGVDEAQLRSMVAAVQEALPALVKVWTAAFAIRGRTFEPPRVAYFGWSRGRIPEIPAENAPACPIVYDNAYYCADTREIYYDAVFLTRLGAAVATTNGTSGRFAPIAVVAHELGHAVDDELGVSGGEPHREELVADCFSGAAVAEAQRAAAGPSRAVQAVQLTTPLVEGQLAMSFVGGPQPRGVHAAGQERSNYFTRGFNIGIDSCAIDLTPVPLRR